MSNWKQNLSKFITGESTVYDGDNWVVKNKTDLFGSNNWILGQEGVCPYEYIINVQVNVPSGYSKEKAAAEAGTLIYENMLKSHKNIKMITLWDYNLLFGGQSESDVNSFVSELKNLKAATPTPEEEIDWKLVVCCILAVSAIVFFSVKIK